MRYKLHSVIRESRKELLRSASCYKNLCATYCVLLNQSEKFLNRTRVRISNSYTHYTHYKRNSVLYHALKYYCGDEER